MATPEKHVPSVTGVSPVDGTPGTKLTIRGENLGVSINDIIHVFVGDYDVCCSVVYSSNKRLSIITPLGEGQMKIIVETKSGGKGTCSVVYNQSLCLSVGLQEEVPYWPPSEQSKHQLSMDSHRRSQPKHMQSEMMENIQDVMLGHQGVAVNFVLSEEEIAKMYYSRGSTALTDTNFDAILYLLSHHYNTNYDDLVNTLQAYKDNMANDKMREPVSIVRANLYTIFQCLDCLEALKDKMDDERTTKREMSGAFVEGQLCKTLEECKKISNYMYHEVLKRREYSDSARSALTVMQRFKFLFNLPFSIRENIAAGEYSLVINDYLRARNLFGKSTIRLFQQVYKDVEEVISQFREMLRRQLLDMPCRCDSTKVTVRLLRQLDVDYDPTWLCLEQQHQWILNTIGRLSMTSSTHMAVAAATVSGVGSNNSSWNHHAVQQMQQLNRLMTDTFTEMWSLAGYYLEYETGGQGELLDNRRQAVTNMTVTVAAAYAGKVREGLAQPPPPGWLAYCLQQVRMTVEALPVDELAVACTATLISLLEEMRTKAVRSLLLKSEQDITSLSFKENWNTEMNDDCGAITRLPALYRNIMVGCFFEVNRVLHSRHKLEKPVCNTDSEKDEFCGWIVSAMRAYITCSNSILDKVVSSRDTELSSPGDGLTTRTDRTAVGCASRLLLLLASNCHYCDTVVNPAVIDQMRLLNLPCGPAVSDRASQAFSALHERIVHQYVAIRLEPLLTPIEQGMRTGGYDWRRVLAPTGARGYMHQLLAGLAQAHAELELVSPHLCQRCLVALAVRAVEEVNRVVETCRRSEWSNRANVQLAVDLTVFEMVFQALRPGSGPPVVVAMWQEATSLMNVMRGAYRPNLEEQTQIKTCVDRDKNYLKMLINGFEEVGKPLATR